MSDEVLRKVDVDWLLSIYGALLTDKQRTMAALYYDEDLSLAEIAQQENVSRQCVHETLQRVERQLRSWEEKLSIRRRLTQVENELNQAISVRRPCRVWSMRRRRAAIWKRRFAF